MKNATIFILLFAFLIACSNGKDKPDVAGIKVSVPIERLDRDFFSIDTNNISDGLLQLVGKYPGFYKDFMEHIIGVSAISADSNTVLVTREILRSYRTVYDTIEQVYKNTGKLQSDLEKAFKYVKYYFPNYKTGKAILFVGPFDAPGVATTPEGLAIDRH